jgi:hypothetical protein
LDYRRALAALLTLAACAAASGSAEFPIREARWLAEDGRLAGLSTIPAACVKIPENGKGAHAFAVGEVAFRTPLLLGGQAARVGLSCASCHPNGRRNEAFAFPGLSGHRGTADVTSSILSSHRGDGAFNPKRIPDLAIDAPKVSRDLANPTLRAFIRAQIVEEFDGAEPSAAILDGLTVYVGAHHAVDCDASHRVPVNLHSDIDQLKTALDLAQRASARGDSGVALLMMQGARATLGHIFERYAGSTLATPRAQILAFDRQLQAAQAKLTAGSSIILDPLGPRADTLAEAIAPFEQQSLYNRDVLARALGG